VLVLMLLLGLGACGKSVTTRIDPALNLDSKDFRTAANHWPEEGEHDLDFLEIYDPWEPMNRHLYDFNAGLDEVLLLPVTNVYDTVLPSPVRTGVDNVIENLNEVPTLVNCLLQGKGEKSAITTSRFLINSTFGVFGLCLPLFSRLSVWVRQHDSCISITQDGKSGLFRARIPNPDPECDMFHDNLHE